MHLTIVFQWTKYCILCLLSTLCSIVLSTLHFGALYTLCVRILNTLYSGVLNIICIRILSTVCFDVLSILCFGDFTAL